MSMAASAAPCGPAWKNLEMPTIDGKSKKLCDYQGQVTLVVNVASRCGYTPQYEGLEALYQKYRQKGFVILGFPSNNFGGQEPGTNAEIKKFCSLNYGVSFDLFAKSDVKGSAQNPLYARLTEARPDNPYAGAIKWNFNKFLVNREGQVVGRYDSKVEPLSSELTQAIEKIL